MAGEAITERSGLAAGPGHPGAASSARATWWRPISSCCSGWSPRLGAIAVDRYDAARAEADAADERVAAAGDGEELPPYLGVPCTIKESIGFEGMPNTAGVVARRGQLATASAPTDAARCWTSARSRWG